jgi:DNA-binding NarL/FixJ family response regulator
MLLTRVSGINVVAEADNGRDALTQIEKFHPNLVLLDVVLPRLNGIEVASRTKQQFPTVRTVILTAFANQENVLRAVRAGASGYVLKQADSKELEVAIRAVSCGDSYFSPRVSNYLVNNLLCPSLASASLDHLTSRQREVLQLIAEGHSNKEIADVLKISYKTVETYRLQLMQALGVHNVVGLIRYAIRQGLVRDD